MTARAQPMLDQLRDARQVSRAREPRRAVDSPTLERAPRVTRENVVALQRSAGNRAMAALLRQATAVSLTPPQAKAAAEETRRRFGENSIRAIQEVIGLPVPDGRWTERSVHSLVRFQERHRMPRASGTVDSATLDALIANGVAQGMQNEVIHLVAEFFDLDTYSDTLSIRHDPALPGRTNVRFSSGRLRKIAIGDQALKSFSSIKSALQEALAVPAPGVPYSPVPASGLSMRSAVDAAKHNNAIDALGRRSVRAIQGLLGEDPSGRFTVETSHRIADLQAEVGVGGGGKLDEYTLPVIVGRLVARGDGDEAVRLIADWYRLDESAALDVVVDTRQHLPFVASSAGRGSASAITFGDPRFSMSIGHAAFVHDVEQGFAQASANSAGLTSQEARFLGERARIMSELEDVFATSGTPHASLGFVGDARSALAIFLDLPPSLQHKLRSEFKGLRRRVVERFKRATPEERSAHAAVLAEYRAVAL